ncbi:hypothetical protein J5X92_01790 [Alteromonas sp. K632G]|uniref:hypothetical protein n=1 Tax=Alteromonas sp. K632G TaxID=2820757 RepID=UPI001AD640A9|nr:hypothetical protein [Alteromonas sp. K632G]MBO7920948.1 hypothetical protein [Alteromonas sp. K632G]
MSNVKIKPMCFRPTPELEQRINEAALREQRSKSQIIALCVESGIRRFENSPTTAIARQE